MRRRRVQHHVLDKLTPERKMDEIDAKKVPPTGIFEIVPESKTGKYHSAEPGHKIYQ